MARASANGVELNYELAGDGPRLLLVGGTGQDLRNLRDGFDPPGLADFTRLRYDQRGLGQSSKPDVPYTMADYADDAAGLLDALGWDRAHVLGISFGGMVAQHVAIRHPGRVERLVLACTSSGGRGGSSYPLHELDLATAGGQAAVLGLLDSRPEQAAVIAREITALAAAAPPVTDPETVMGARRQLEARAGHDAYEQLGRIHCPTLVAAGRYDALAPLANSEALAARIPGARLEVFDGGHVFMLQDPRAWPVMLGFLVE
jgi:3-oxoadipate enol-lactonase